MPLSSGLWRGAQGLPADVRYYRQWMRDEAERRIGHLYPQVEITEEMVRERPDLKRYKGRPYTDRFGTDAERQLIDHMDDALSPLRCSIGLYLGVQNVDAGRQQ